MAVKYEKHLNDVNKLAVQYLRGSLGYINKYFALNYCLDCSYDINMELQEHSRTMCK